MIKKVICFVAILSCVNSLLSQTLYDKVWVLVKSRNYTCTFDGFTVSNQYLDTFFAPSLGQGHANICDKNGSLQLYTNGFNIYNFVTDIIENGDSITPKEIIIKLNGYNGLSQSSLFLPFPNNKYFLFTPTASDNEVNTYWKNPSLGRALYDELLYHVIDMNANGGKGKVVQKGIPLLQNVLLSKTNMMACKHGNGGEWWLLKQAHDTNMVYKFLVKDDGVYNMGTQGFAEPHFGKWDQGGQAMFSQDGSQYAVCIRGGGEQAASNPPPVTPGKIFVADFNRCDGILSNPRVFQTKPNQYINPFDSSTLFENYTEGLCFSPNGRFLYVASYYSIKQLDLLDPDTNTQWTKIADMDTTWLAFQNYGPLYLGPDEKIYIGNWNGLSKQMSVINNPNAKGAACQFCPRCLRFPNIGVSSPPCMPNYHLGAWVGGPCSPLLSEDVESRKNKVLIYPNPFSEQFTIEYNLNKNEKGVIKIIDIIGSTIATINLDASLNKTTINLRNLNSGIYTYSFYIDGVKQSNGKLIKE